LLQLVPSDAVGRAAARLLIQRFSDKFVPAFYKLLVLQVRRRVNSVLHNECSSANQFVHHAMLLCSYIHFAC
jgi:hypothetical protein